MAELRQSTMFPGMPSTYSAQQCLEILNSLKRLRRTMVERIWECALRYYRYTHTDLTVEVLISEIERHYPDPPRSMKSYSRAREKVPMLVPWPIRWGDRPPWEGAISINAEPVERKADDALFTVAPQAEQVAAGQMMLEGKPVVLELGEKRITLELLANGLIGWRPLTQALAAGIALATLFDNLDGVPDGGLRFCHVLHTLAPLVTR